MAGIKDVARLAGVSIGTVSNVVNRPERVAPATRERVERAIEELGYVPNAFARRLLGAPSRIIGLVVRDITNPFYADLAHGVQEVTAARELAVVLCSSDKQHDKEARFLRLLAEQQVGGVIITPAADVGDSFARERARGCPVVLLDRHADRGEFCSVAADNARGGALAVEHLLGLGHRRIAFVRDQESNYQHDARHAGALRQMERAGAGADNLVLLRGAAARSGEVPVGQDAVDLLLGLSPRPTAVVCSNDMIALGMLQTLLARGVRVPDDIALVGYDDIQFAAAAAIPITSVRQPRHQMGRRAAELLLAEIDDQPYRGVRLTPHRHHQEQLPPELVVRASSVPRP